MPHISAKTRRMLWMIAVIMVLLSFEWGFEAVMRIRAAQVDTKDEMIAAFGSPLAIHHPEYRSRGFHFPHQNRQTIEFDEFAVYKIPCVLRTPLLLVIYLKQERVVYVGTAGT